MLHTETIARTKSVSGANDVSAAERLLSDVIDTLREPLLVLDSEFRVTRTNRAFFQTFRVGPDETIGKVLFALGDGQWDIAALRELRDGIVPDTELYDLDVDRVFPGIGRKIMLLNARLVTHGVTASPVILLAIEDVTERRLSERRLAAQRLELQRSNAALNEFAFVASHDLQEPLRKIVSFGERLSHSVGPLLDGNPRQYLDRMLGAAARMRTLINDLLAYSQVATNTERFAPTDLGAIVRDVVADLGAIVRDVVADLETVIADAGARVDVAPLPVIEADAAQMRRLLQNLLGNALKFRRTDVPLVVRVAATIDGDGFCTITVTDNGIGFRAEHGERIFRMFERLHPRAQYEGSGMGLAICRRVVERYGGSIAATSSAGQGTTFTVTLPVTQGGVEQSP
jgi:signal transduction histidine kinase